MADVAYAGARLRFGAALALSIACHALQLVVARAWLPTAQLTAPLVVTMVERGGGSERADVPGGSDGAAPVPG